MWSDRRKAIARRGILVAIAAVLAASCGPQPSHPVRHEGDAAAPGDRVSLPSCTTARRALDQMAAMSRGGFAYDEGGEARIEDKAWKDIPPALRANLATLVATVAACPDGAPSEAVITFKGMQSGEILGQGNMASFAAK